MADKKEVEVKSLNVYGKLAKARVMLQEKEVKKSGRNKHLNFSYMELEDFLPEINRINNEIGLLTVFTVFEAEAFLKIIDTSDEGKMITFNSPVAQAKLQGNASPIQELGALHTYMRRYLLLMAYEICESDAMDGAIGNPKDTPEESKKISEVANQKISTVKASLIEETAKKAKVNMEQILIFCGVEKTADITEDWFIKSMDKLKLTIADLEKKNKATNEII